MIIDNQFRPTPSSKLLPAVFDAIEAAGVSDVRVVCANGKVFPMSESDMEQKIGRDNLARMETNGWAFHQNDPQNPDAYTFVGVSSGGTPIWLHNEVATSDLKITIGQAQANHWGAGGGGKLILPGVVSDATVESNHCAFVTSPQTHYGAYAGPMRSDIDEVATMCGLDCTMNVILDTHGRVIDCIFGSHPEAHREAIRRFNAIYAYDSWVEEKGQADIVICGVFAPTDHLFFHTGWGCMSADLVLKDGGTIIYTSPSPGVSTAIGDFPGFALMDLMKPYMPPTAENYERVLQDIHKREIQMWAGCIWVPIYEVMTRKHLTVVTLEENLDMAADIGLDATTSLDEAFAAAMERHGADAKVAVLPYARYQLPTNAVRMASGSRACWRTRGYRTTALPETSRTAIPGVSAGERRRRQRRRSPADPRLDDDPRDPPHVSGRPGCAADVADLLAVRPLRRRRPRAADDGGAPPCPRPARGTGGVSGARARRPGRGAGGPRSGAAPALRSDGCCSPVTMYALYIVQRTQIYLDERQDMRLRRLAAAGGVTRSALVRVAVDRYLEEAESATTPLDSLHALLDELESHPLRSFPDGASYVEALRRGDIERQAALDRHRGG